MNKKKILITGGLGYVGTSLCELLSNNKDYNITVIDNQFNPERISWLVYNNIRFYQKDIFDIKDLLEDCDICYHLAGITDVPQTPQQSNPEKDAQIIKIGTGGTRYIIENINKDAKIIFASTQVVYDGLKQERLGISEDIEPCPIVAYSQSKRQSELDLFNSNKNFTIARFASVYGYNKNMRWRILPNLLSKMTSQNQDLKVFGAENYKPLISVADLVRSLDFLAKSNYNREIFHCVNENLRVVEIANICKEINPTININIIEGDTPNKGFTLSNKKLLDVGFRFRNNIRNEIEKMINLWRNK